MLFPSIEFLSFIVVFLILLHCLRGVTQPIKKYFILAGSYFFYAYWDWRFVGLLAGLTIVNHLCGKMIQSEQSPGLKRMWLFMALGVDIATLSFFKYYNFFLDSARGLLTLKSLPLRNLDLILPLGISFLTFQIMSYVIDVYRGQVKSGRLDDFALYVSFFPKLVAGPITRANDFFTQLEKKIEIRKENVLYGVSQFVIGLFKKVVLADNLASFINEVFQKTGLFDGYTILAAVIAYSIQIYCDFSGYSDMAIGTGKMLGFDLPVNFLSPYRSKNIGEFWRRWHISLSQWLRDYLYIPLGGNRTGLLRTCVNLIITMVIGGLWHGAGWNFVIWGFFHGCMLVFQRLFRATKTLVSLIRNTPQYQPIGLDQRIPRIGDRSNSGKHILWYKFLGAEWLTTWRAILTTSSIFMTFIFVTAGWIFFRAQNLSDAVKVFNGIANFSTGIHWIHSSFWFIVPWCLIWQLLPNTEKWRERLILSQSSIGVAAKLCLFFAVIFFSPVENSPFIYVQF
jgi:alginate O-acetyltransferase complex protein AlgI